MAKKKTETNKGNFTATCSSVVNGVISIFLLIAVVVLPLIYDNSYFNILETKYKCFYVSVLAMLAVLLILSISMFVIDRSEYQGVHTKEFFGRLHWKNWKQLSVADIAVIVFWIVCVISTMQSEYVYESFWGNEGRFCGLFLMTLYVLMYFVVSRLWKGNKLVLQAFLIAGMIVCGIGITDYFQLDILRFRTHIKPEQSTVFTSTIGNINTYTAYVALVMGVSAALFVTENNRLKSFWYYACMTISFFAIILGCSDNAYLALGALFAFLPLLVFRSKKGVFRYVVMLATFVTVIQCIDLINQKYADMVIGLDSLFQILVNLPALWFLVFGMWLFALAVYVGLYGKGFRSAKAELGTEEDAANAMLLKVWTILLIAGAAGIVFMVIDANVFGNAMRYGALRKYLVFNDRWGTNRGYIWKKSIQLYENFPVMHKLFGYGPDTFGIMTTRKFMTEMVDLTGQIFDSAHNEYLQYLLTIGPIGVGAYVLFLLCNSLKMAGCWLRNKQNSSLVIGCMFAVVCYSIQAVVNLNLPIVTPVMWVLMSMGIASVRNKI